MCELAASIVVSMASFCVVDLLKTCGRCRGASFRMLLQQSLQVTELQCRPHEDRCSRCWLSYSCHKAVGPKPEMLDLFPWARGLRTLPSVSQKICKKYYQNGTKCCTDEPADTGTTIECWQCGRSIDDVTERYFCDCGVVQPPIAERNYFDVMGIKETFDVDLTELTEKYRGLQRILHPDKYSQKCDTEKGFSLQHSAIVNRAYNTLQKPLARGLYMLHLSEDNLEHEVQHALSELFNEVMEVNEALLEADTPDAIAVIGAKNQSKIDSLVEHIACSFRQNDHVTAKELLLRLKYYSNIDTKIKELLQKYVG